MKYLIIRPNKTISAGTTVWICLRCVSVCEVDIERRERKGGGENECRNDLWLKNLQVMSTAECE
jgi:hypothetical protein